MGEIGKIIHPKRELRASGEIRKVIGELESGFSRHRPFPIGKVDKKVVEFARENNIELGGHQVYMTVKQIAHALRGSKVNKGLAVSKADIIQFPKTMRTMSIYYDGSFIYTNGKLKFIIKPNHKIKMPNGKARKVCFITAGRVTDGKEFGMLSKYRKVR